jgi:hypothetical protein
VALLADARRNFARFGLDSDELQWIGRPPAGLRLRRADIFLIPFSFVWCGFAILVAVGAAGSRAPWPLLLVAAFFVAIGLYVTIGRFWWDAYRRSTTWYGLTGDAALMLREGLGGSVQRIYLPSLDSLDLRLKPDGTGTISFGKAPAIGAYSSWAIWSGGPAVPTFEEISDAKRVYNLCVAAQRAGLTPKPSVVP